MNKLVKFVDFKTFVFSLTLTLVFALLFLNRTLLVQALSNFSITGITANCNGTGQVFFTGVIPEGGFTLTLYDKHLGNGTKFVPADPLIQVVITSGTSPVSYQLNLTNWTGGPHYRVDSNFKTKSDSLNCSLGGDSPIDCQLSNWSECSASCDGGTQTRTVIQEPQNGGQECGVLTQSCNTQACGTLPTNSPTPTTTPGPTNLPIGGPNGQVGAPICTMQQPPAPQLLSVTSLSSTSVRLNWSPVVPSTYYSISYGTSPSNFQFGVPNVGNVNSFEIGSLDPNSNYYFSVRGVNECMPGDPSNVLSRRNVLTGQVLGASTEKLAETSSLNEFGRLVSGAFVALNFFVFGLARKLKPNEKVS